VTGAEQNRCCQRNGSPQPYQGNPADRLGTAARVALAERLRDQATTFGLANVLVDP